MSENLEKEKLENEKLSTKINKSPILISLPIFSSLNFSHTFRPLKIPKILLTDDCFTLAGKGLIGKKFLLLFM